MSLDSCLKIFVNDERTRTFIAISIVGSAEPPSAVGPVRGDLKRLLKAIGAVNKAFVMHGLQVYYKVINK